MNTLIVFFTSRHLATTSAFFSSMMLSLAGKNLVISTGEGRSRSALNSTSLMEEGLEEVLSQSPGVLEGERNIYHWIMY